MFVFEQWSLKKKMPLKLTDLQLLLAIGAVHKLRLQQEGGRWSKELTFVNFHTIKIVNGGG